MQSNYRLLGNYIREVNVRNTELKVDKLMGVSIQKELMPSIANTVGTNMRTYKILKKRQFAYGPVTSRNGDKISVALLEDYDEVIISQAYTSFEIINIDKLLPEYLMMWFRRSEFDRYARFMSHGSAREVFGWEELCNTKLPVPSIETQRAIVIEYNTVKNRIALNNQLIQKLEETAQAIYKQWFVDFEFPDENGNPYKSSGGKMVFNEELEKEIPEGWEVSRLGNICEVIDCLHSKKPDEVKNGHKILLQVSNLKDLGLIDTSIKYLISDKDYENWTSRIELRKGDCVVTNVGKDAFAQIPHNFKAALGRNLTGIRLKEEFNYPYFLICLLNSNYMKREVENFKDTGTIMQALNVSNIPKLRFLMSNRELVQTFNTIVSLLRKEMELKDNLNYKLSIFKELLLSKLASIES